MESRHFEFLWGQVVDHEAVMGESFDNMRASSGLPGWTGSAFPAYSVVGEVARRHSHQARWVLLLLSCNHLHYHKYRIDFAVPSSGAEVISPNHRL